MTYAPSYKALIQGLSFLTLALCLMQPAVAQLSYRKGQHVEPAYEGWRANEDGTYSLIFGYMNENWEEELDIPVGDNNFFSPGDADRGQPTHFLPRRNRFTFEVVVPSDWGDREMVWTVTSPNGESRKAYGTLAADYVIDNVVIASETGSLGAGTSSPESRANVPPQAEVIGDATRTVRVGQPLTFQTRVVDDGIPKADDPMRQARQLLALTGNDAAGLFLTPEAVYKMRMARPPTRVTVGKTNGLYLSWNVYRGPLAANRPIQDVVTFDPPQVKPWEDTRTGANSPWGALWVPPAAPDDGIYEVSVTFDEPGTYVLWGRADDGGLFHDQYLTVTVTP
jgi:hypothetical protein